MPDSRSLVAALERLGLVDGAHEAVLTPLTGGVASDIFRVDTPTGRFVVKRALEKLRVAADWHVTTARNATEVAWLDIAGRVVPGAAPAILGHDPGAGLFAMEFLDPSTHPVWKAELLAGRVDAAFAATVGAGLAQIHGATAGDDEIRARFDTTETFRSIRLDPYLGATAARHPALADTLLALSRGTADLRIALVHGDVSPKNILCGPAGAVFLDAECAWYGDPAFDLAFCLNHLLLKCIAVPSSTPRLLDAFDALSRSYLDRVGWEEPDRLEARASALLPALLLARVDGKSPVEYVEDGVAKDRLRMVAGPLIASAPPRLAAIQALWQSAFSGAGEV